MRCERNERTISDRRLTCDEPPDILYQSAAAPAAPNAPAGAPAYPSWRHYTFECPSVHSPRFFLSFVCQMYLFATVISTLLSMGNFSDLQLSEAMEGREIRAFFAQVARMVVDRVGTRTERSEHFCHLSMIGDWLIIFVWSVRFRNDGHVKFITNLRLCGREWKGERGELVRILEFLGRCSARETERTSWSAVQPWT